MTANDKDTAAALVSCEICMKEVPLNEATNPETEDYVVHFCGLACYEQWKDQKNQADATGKKPV